MPVGGQLEQRARWLGKVHASSIDGPEGRCRGWRRKQEELKWTKAAGRLTAPAGTWRSRPSTPPLASARPLATCRASRRAAVTTQLTTSAARRRVGCLRWRRGYSADPGESGDLVASGCPGWSLPLGLDTGFRCGGPCARAAAKVKDRWPPGCTTSPRAARKYIPDRCIDIYTYFIDLIRSRIGCV